MDVKADAHTMMRLLRNRLRAPVNYPQLSRGDFPQARLKSSLVEKLPPRGVYVLVLRLAREKQLGVGSLGEMVFKKGYYAYIGSARRGLRSRAARHATKEKSMRWHIDYLTSLADAKICTVMAASRTGVECLLASTLRKEADGYVARFGSTDCGCTSHLYYFSSYAEITRALMNSGLSYVWHKTI